MTRLACVLILSLAAAPLAAQSTEGDAPGFLDGLMEDLAPALRGLEGLGGDLGAFARQMGPALEDLLERVQDWSVYHPPEVLPNGDIIIRRKQDAPPPRRAPDGGITL